MAKVRITSIDIFRGLTMILMIIVNAPGDWDHVYAPLLHSEWNGCTLTDLVFPFFVFAMGMSIPFGSKINSGITGDQFKRITARTLRLINLGLAINFFGNIEITGISFYLLVIMKVLFAVIVAYLMMGKFSTQMKLILAIVLFALFMTLAFGGFTAFETTRVPGVLQRLGIVYFAAGLLFLALDFKKQLILCAVLLLGYWAVLALIPVPGGGPANYDGETNLLGYIDTRLMESHLWAGRLTWNDPEGLLSNIPAMVSGFLGIWCGMAIKKGFRTLKLSVIGIALIIGGLIWGLTFPINKSLWSSSYVLYTAGIAFLLMSLFIPLFDGKKENLFTKIVLMWGLNPITVYYGSEILPQILGALPIGKTTAWGYLYSDVFKYWFVNLKNGSLLFAFANVVLWSIVLTYMKMRRWVVKV